MFTVRSNKNKEFAIGTFQIMEIYLKQFWSKTNRWHRGLIIMAIVQFKLIPGGQLGFYCNDPALSHPYTGDTISWKMLLATVTLLPLVVMLIIERRHHYDKSRMKQQVLCWYREYLFGELINLIVLQSVKLAIGAPRPHFFDSCHPKEATTCQESEYVHSYTCTKPGWQWVSQSDKSFPSGHTSLTVHMSFYLMYYLYRRTTRSTLVLTSHLLLFLATVYCGLSRMLDHRHHWWDVLAGAALALPILYYTINCLCCNFECTSPLEKCEEASTDHQGDGDCGKTLLNETKDI